MTLYFYAVAGICLWNTHLHVPLIFFATYCPFFNSSIRIFLSDLISGEETEKKKRKKKRENQFLALVHKNLNLTGDTVGSLEIHKMFESRAFENGGLSISTLLPPLTFPLPEETRRKFLQLEKNKRERKGGNVSHHCATPLFSITHYIIGRKEQSTWTYYYDEKCFIKFNIMERPCAGVRSGYIIYAAQYKNENVESPVQRAGKKSVIKILNSKVFSFLCKLSFSFMTALYACCLMLYVRKHLKCKLLPRLFLVIFILCHASFKYKYKSI